MLFYLRKMENQTITISQKALDDLVSTCYETVSLLEALSNTPQTEHENVASSLGVIGRGLAASADDLLAAKGEAKNS